MGIMSFGIAICIPKSKPSAQTLTIYHYMHHTHTHTQRAVRDNLLVVLQFNVHVASKLEEEGEGPHEVGAVQHMLTLGQQCTLKN